MKFTKIGNVENTISDFFTYSILADRGIVTEGIYDQYLYPTKEQEISPYKLDNIQEACDLYRSHLALGSTICLCIDCDADGYTSAAALYNYYLDNLYEKYPDVEWKFNYPSGKEHGLETIMNRFVKEEKDCDLIILPDSSSNDYEYHKILKELGYDILVLDHHHADKYSEDAIVVNNQLSKEYSNKFASGVGVVYKFLEVIDKEEGLNCAEKYLDLVALGEISDMMSMNSLENRYVCYKGLRQVTNPLFQEMVKKQCYSLFGEKTFDTSHWTDGKLTQMGVSWYITPLINALIRVGTPQEKENLFHSFINGNKEVPSTKRGAKGEMETLKEQVTRNCVNARTHQNKDRDKAVELLDITISNDCLDDNKILILNADDLDVSTTLTGLVAMGVAAKYKKPTMLGRTAPNGCLKGSIRGKDGTELKDFRQFLIDSGLVEYAEGHPNAAGFSIKQKNIPKLYKYANEKLKDINFNEGVYEADFILNSAYPVLKEMVNDIGAHSEIWGQSNDEPILVIKNIPIKASDITMMGANKDVMKFQHNGVTFICYKASDLYEEIKNKSYGAEITVVGTASINEFRGITNPQITIKDMEINDFGF